MENLSVMSEIASLIKENDADLAETIILETLITAAKIHA